MLDEANSLKTRGNDLFRSGDWQRSLEVYMEGLHVLPPRLKPSSKGKEKAEDTATEPVTETETGVIAESASSSSTVAPSEDTTLSQLDLMEQQCSVLRSIFNSNIAACHVKLVRHYPHSSFF